MHSLLGVRDAELLNLCELVDAEDTPHIFAVLVKVSAGPETTDRQGKLTAPASLRKQVE